MRGKRTNCKRPRVGSCAAVVAVALLASLGAVFVDDAAAAAAFVPRRTTLQTFRRQTRNSRSLAERKLGSEGSDEKQDKKVIVDEVTDDFPAWVQGLSQWPLSPVGGSTTSADGRGDPNKQQRRRATTGGSLQNPLSSLLDIEALLALEKPDGGGLQQVDELISSLTGDAIEPLASIDGILDAGSWTLGNMTTMEEMSAWKQWVGALQDRMGSLAGGGGQLVQDSAAQRKLLDGMLQQATGQIESFISEATSVLTKTSIEDFVVKANQVIQQSTSNATNFINAAKDIAIERGLDVGDAAKRAAEAIDFSNDLVTVADRVMRKGYVPGDAMSESNDLPNEVPSMDGSRALFADFDSVSEISTISPPLLKAAEMGALSGAIYEETVKRTQALDHAIVAEGVTEDVRWMVTDSVASRSSFPNLNQDSYSEESFLLRTITIRGYDASDEDVDRELLINRVCTATPVQMRSADGLLFHSGLLEIARAIYKDIEQYLDQTSPSHTVVLTGHSIGGSLSLLVLFLMTLDRGAAFVRSKVLQVFTFGSPPVVRFEDGRGPSAGDQDILGQFDLPSTIVKGYVQPWDPIVRLFTPYDPLYPLVDDMGEDGVTPWISGPPRTLRPITKAILEAWDGWPGFRENFGGTAAQSYVSVGPQFILVPEATRYLADRFVSVNVAVPPIVALVRVSSEQLLPSLETVFPLDVFEISFVPQAIRGFIHHFYPAYGTPLVDFVADLEEQASQAAGDEATASDIQSKKLAGGPSAENDSDDNLLDLGRAARWLTGEDS